MKKKKFLTLVATGLMACLVAAMGGMTYSKYITNTKTGDQQATAAKWGFVMTANTENLFGKMYNNANKETGKPATDGKPATIVQATAEGISVEASSDKFIVAPGTKGSMTIAISGTAEVRAQLTLTASGTPDEICLTDYGTGDAVNVNYYPIVWTLTNGTEPVGTPGKLKDVLDALADTSQIIEANSTYEKNYTLSWEWPLETNATNNIYDTIIGYKSSGEDWDAISKYVGNLTKEQYVSTTNIITGISFNIDVTIAQIQ